ncbi:unnamed protein product [Durusdinium trenchii]|uniref:Uncharacterized protein n=1 Tax=Durusdinium trenchii TaxID=1381693 RepID=A0ABP0J6U9_9DINO
MSLAPETYGCADADADGSPISPHGDSEALLLNMKDPEVDEADTNADTPGDLEQAEPATLPQDATVASEPKCRWCPRQNMEVGQTTKMTCTLVTKMLFMVLPHVLFVYTVSNVKAENLQACNDEAGCVYQRLLDSRSVASTGAFFASVRNGEANIVTLSPSTYGHQPANFTFTSETHSSEVDKMEQRLQISRVVPQLLMEIARLPCKLFQTSPAQLPALCQDMTLTEMQVSCNSLSMKMGFENHLLGAGMYTSLFFTALWGVLHTLA